MLAEGVEMSNQERNGPCDHCNEHYGENIWQRAFDATIFLKIHGFMTDSEGAKVRRRIDASYDSMRVQEEG